MTKVVVVTLSFNIFTAFKIQLRVSWKLCLNLCWKLCLNLCYRRSLKPSLNLVGNCILFGLLQRKTLFPEGCINFTMFPLKLLKISEGSNPLYSILSQKGKRASYRHIL